MESRSALKIWEAALGELELQVSKPNYRTWLIKTSGLECQDDKIIIGVPNTFVAEYLDKNQRSLIERTLIHVCAHSLKPVFRVNNPNKDAFRENSLPIETDTSPILTGQKARLNPRYTFDNFVVGDCNRLAFTAALESARQPGQVYNPLFIFGGVGVGKTHLLQAIGQQALTDQRKVVYVNGERFTSEFVGAIRNQQMDLFRNKYRGADMVLMDDIQFISGKEQTEECFFHTFNELYNSGHQIVIASDQSPNKMTSFSQRLRSRFQWGLTADIKTPDLATRRTIVKNKAQHTGYEIEPDVLDLIAKQISDNIRELEGGLNRVIAFAKLLRSTLTPELAAKALQDIRTAPQLSSPQPEQIISAVANYFQLPPEQLTGRKRDKATALARNLAMYLLHQESGISLTEIGREFDGRNPSTVSHACEKIAADMQCDPTLNRRICNFKETLFES